MSNQNAKDKMISNRKRQAKLDEKKKKIYTAVFVIAIILSIVFTIGTITNLQKLQNMQSDSIANAGTPAPTQPTIKPQPDQDATENSTENPNKVNDGIPNLASARMILYKVQSDFNVYRDSVNLSNKPAAKFKISDGTIKALSEQGLPFDKVVDNGVSYICMLDELTRPDDVYTFNFEGAQADDSTISFFGSTVTSELNVGCAKDLMYVIDGSYFDMNAKKGTIKFLINDSSKEVGYTLAIYITLSEDCRVLLTRGAQERFEIYSWAPTEEIRFEVTSKETKETRAFVGGKNTYGATFLINNENLSCYVSNASQEPSAIMFGDPWKK